MRSPCYSCDKTNRDICSETCQKLKEYQLYVYSNEDLIGRVLYRTFTAKEEKRGRKKNKVG